MERFPSRETKPRKNDRKNSEKYVDSSMIQEQIKTLKEEAKKIADTLKREYPGLKLDNEGRIIIPSFDEEALSEVSRIKEEFEKDTENLGEMLELFKFVKINEENANFLTIRTSEYDDFFNHIDEIIYHKETLEPIMAIDITTASDEEVQLNKLSKFIQILNKGGGKVKYGFFCKRDKNGEISFQRSKLSQIPVLIVHMTVKDLLERIKDKEFNFSEWLENLIKSQLPSIINGLIEPQIKIASGDYKTRLKNLKEKYENLKNIFNLKSVS